MRLLHVVVLGAVALSPLFNSKCAVAEWAVESRGSLVLDTSGVAGVAELSGAVYIADAGGASRFYAVQDDGDQVVQFSVTFGPDGTLITAVAETANSLSPASFDTEGVALGVTNGSSVFLSEETTPGVREFDLATGLELQSVTLPSVFSSARANRGLESLTRQNGPGVMWTANEEALTIDGPTANDVTGTSVRLQRLDINGTTISANAQFAYQVDPVHDNHIPEDGGRSGLVDLVALDDGTLLALERSLGFSSGLGIPTFESRIYEINFEERDRHQRGDFRRRLDWANLYNGLEGTAVVWAAPVEFWVRISKAWRSGHKR